jgi:hypothetical protein
MSISSVSCFLFLINIIIGTGVFLNTVPLYFLLQEYSYLAYVLTGILMMPIMWITYVLASVHVGFNLTQLFEYYFGQHNRIFIPLYALSKLATAVIGLIFISSVLKNIFFSAGSSVIYQGLVFFIFYLFAVLLVFYDISLHSMLQKTIILFKLIPLIGVIFLFLYYFLFKNTPPLLCMDSSSVFDGWKLAQGASITIFAFAGFESLFAISHLLSGNKRGGAILLMTSFISSLILYCVYQFAIGNIATYAAHINVAELSTFSDFLAKLFLLVPHASIFIMLFNIAIILSSFGVLHGIMYATVNNIFCGIKDIIKTIKNAKYLVFVLVPIYALFGMRNIFILQQLSSLGTIITYLLFLLCYRKINESNLILFILSLISISIFVLVHLYNAYYYFGFYGYMIYGVIFLVLSIVIKIHGKKRIK